MSDLKKLPIYPMVRSAILELSNFNPGHVKMARRMTLSDILLSVEQFVEQAEEARVNGPAFLTIVISGEVYYGSHERLDDVITRSVSVNDAVSIILDTHTDYTSLQYTKEADNVYALEIYDMQSSESDINGIMVLPSRCRVALAEKLNVPCDDDFHAVFNCAVNDVIKERRRCEEREASL